MKNFNIEFGIPPGADGTTPSIGSNGNWFVGEIDTGTGATGSAGEDGISPTIGLNGNWFIGDTDTGIGATGPVGATGPTGATGATGPVGATGATGSAGVDGISPTIGPNGNWFIGDTDTGVTANQCMIVPYSGNSMTFGITAFATGLPNQSGVLSTGGTSSNLYVPLLVGNQIDVSSGGGNLAFTIPKNCTLSGVSATYYVFSTMGISGTGTASIFVQFFVAPAGGTLFDQVGDTLTLTPAISQISSGVVVAYGNTDLNIPLIVGDQLLLVFGITTSGVGASAGVTGYPNASIIIC